MNVLKPSPRHLRLSNFQYVFRQPPCAPQFLPHRQFSLTCHQRARRNARPSHDLHSDDNVDVNVIEEQVSGNERKRRRLSDEEIDQDIAEDEDLEHDILDLEKSINAFKIPEGADEDIKRQFFTDQELDRMGEGGSINDEDIYPHRIMPQRAIPVQAQIHLKKLNEALDEANTARPGDSKQQGNVWRWYTRSKINVPGFLQMIPRLAWDLIAKSQGSEENEAVAPDRMSRLAILATDKKAAGWDLTPGERYIQIEGTFLDGDQRQALQLFEELSDSDAGKDSKFMEMGVRMYAHHGNPERAHRLADRLFDLNNAADPRVLTPLIRAYAERRNEESMLTAWSLFQDLERRLSTDMRMQEYDTVVLSFLDSGNKDFALAVFRDMMLRGEAEHDYSRQNAFSKLANFIDITRSPQETNDLSLNAIKYLPRKYQNKWFYASWLRKLISEGQVNAASQVVELMYERGVKPDARHLNGITAAWLRDQRSSQKQRAEELGWSMIQRRLDFVQERRPSLSDTQASTSQMQPVSVNSDVQVPVPVSVSRPVPPATIETFCVLLEHYIRRGAYTYVRHLRDLLGPAQLQMNSMFMNRLLSAELQNHGHRRAWTRFEQWSQNTKPDLETWGYLWQCEKNHVHDIRNQDLAGFPLPRDLFGRMLVWLQSLSERERRYAMEDMDENMYQGVVLAFCLHHDLEGTFVAIHTLHAIFDVVPNEAIVRMLLNMFTKLLPVHVAEKEKRNAPRRSRRNKKSEKDRDRDLAAATYLLDSVRRERLQELAGKGIDFDDLGSEARAEENHKTCLAMLARVMQERNTRGSKNVMLNEDSKEIQEAAEECGLDQIDVEKALKVETG